MNFCGKIFLRRLPFLLSGSGQATCECWGPIGLGKEHKEEFHVQAKEGTSHMWREGRKVVKESKGPAQIEWRCT